MRNLTGQMRFGETEKDLREMTVSSRPPVPTLPRAYSGITTTAEEWIRRAVRWQAAAAAAGDPSAIRAAYDARPAPAGWETLENVR